MWSQPAETPSSHPSVPAGLLYLGCFPQCSHPLSQPVPQPHVIDSIITL